MCGILFVDFRCGGAGVTLEQKEEWLVAVGQTLRHRGPDASRAVLIGERGEHGLVFHRLAIVSTDGDEGMQPFTHPDNNAIAMVCSGEIYNYRELELAKGARRQGQQQLRSDVDVVLRMLADALTDEAEVVRRVARLDGDFAFVITDGASERGTVVAGRDPFGVRPLFYAVAKGDDGGESRIVAIASEAKALLQPPPSPSFPFLPQELEVRVFPPGHVLVNGRIVPYFHSSSSASVSSSSSSSSFPTASVSPYPTTPAPVSSDPAPAPVSLANDDGYQTIEPEESGTEEPQTEELGTEEPRSTTTDLARFRELLTRAVEKRVRHSERPVGVLCSGGVDSAVLTAIAAEMPERDALRVFTMRYRHGSSDDAFYASLMCQRLGLRHTVVEFDASDVEGALEDVVRALETRDPNTVRAAVPMYLLARHIARHTDVKVVLSGEGADELLGGYGYIRFAWSVEEAARESDRLLGNLHMFDLLRADRCFAAFGLEVRVPFLDADLVRHGVPAAHRRPDAATGTEKRLLRDAFAHLRVLADCRILERAKEKFSDGTGFSYVPDLLRHVAAVRGADDGTLHTRLLAEQAHYAALFERAYGGRGADLVVERRLPEWGEAARREALGGDGPCRALDIAG
jgi:asparagine synthase (glutamine-hydrolysing)